MACARAAIATAAATMMIVMTMHMYAPPCARAQLIFFTRKKTEPNDDVPRLSDGKADIWPQNERLFDNSADYTGTDFEKREYVFGGYIIRDWKPEVTVDSHNGQFPIRLKHYQCGKGFYSTQFRLNNPPPMDGKERNVQGQGSFKKTGVYDLNALKSTSEYRFKTSVFGRESADSDAAVPCCPFVDSRNKCCEPYEYKDTEYINTDTKWFNTAVNGYMNFWQRGIDKAENGFKDGTDCYQTTYCDNLVEDKEDRKCGLVEEKVYDPGNLLAKDPYVPSESDLYGHGGRYLAYDEISSRSRTCGKNCNKNDVMQALPPAMPPYRGDFRKYKMFCTMDNIAMRAFWGPPEGHDSKRLPDMRNMRYKTHDLWWTKESQCKRCTRFGMMYYTKDNFNSICFKVGPGEAATPEGTGRVPSAVTRNQYIPLVNPQDKAGAFLCGGTKCTKHYTTGYRVIVDMRQAKVGDPRDGLLQVRGTRIVLGNTAGSGQNYDRTFSYDALIGSGTGDYSNHGVSDCRFDTHSDPLVDYYEIRQATRCKIPIDMPVKWPNECPESGDPNAGSQCSLIASLVKHQRQGSPPSDHFPVGSGDTRLFASVQLGSTSPSPPGEDPSVHYYKNNIFEKLLWAVGYELTWELAIVVRPGNIGKGAGCGTTVGLTAYQTEMSYNYFTYYHPESGNYDLATQGAHTFVDSYKQMVAEQRDTMLRFQQLQYQGDGVSPVPVPMKPLPVRGTSETVALCYKKREGICDPNDPMNKYEGLPAQDSDVASRYRGGAATPMWRDQDYYGDFPNYNLADVKDAWGKDFDAFAKANPVVKTIADSDGRKALRAAAECVPCKAGYEGSRGPEFASVQDYMGNLTRVQTGRYLRARLGPFANRDTQVKTLGLRVTADEYRTVCSPCRAGYHNAKPGHTCIRCRPGRFSMTQAARAWVPAFYAQEAPKRCWPCLKGHACPMLGIRATNNNKVCPTRGFGNMCECPVNTYQDERGKEDCKPCPTDTATKQAGSTSLSQCLRNTVRPGFRFRGPYDASVLIGGPKPSNLEEVKCAPGTYSGISRLFSASATRCSDCGRGVYSPMEGSDRCWECPDGEYNNMTGQSACKLCRCERCTPQPTGDDPVNARVDVTRTMCLQAPVNMYNDHYTDPEFKPCTCPTYNRSAESLYCGYPPSYTPAQRRILMNSCVKKLMPNTKNAWGESVSGGGTGMTFFTFREAGLKTASDGKTLSGADTTQRSSPGATDWITIASLVLSLPIIFVSLVVGTAGGFYPSK